MPDLDWFAEIKHSLSSEAPILPGSEVFGDASAPRVPLGMASARPAAASRSVRKSRAEKALGLLLPLLSIAALIGAAVLFLPPLLRISAIEVRGNTAVSSQDIVLKSGIHQGDSLISIDPGKAQHGIEALPAIQSAVVERHFPNRLYISVTERKPLASALVETDGRSYPVCLDSQGVAFAEASASEAISLPVISGLRFENFQLGQRLPSSVTRILSSLGAVSASEPALLSAISEIRVVGTTDGLPGELMIYPINQKIPVRASLSLDAETLRSIILVLDVLGTKAANGSVQEVDFRTGTVVYRTKEGQSD